MDPVTALGVAAAVVQFVQFGIKVSKLLHQQINASPGDLPAGLETINIQLPLILAALARLENEQATAGLEPDTRAILNGVVQGCYKLTLEIDAILQSATAKSGDSFGRRVKKALASMKKEARVVDISQGLLAYVQVLTLHQVVEKTELQTGPPPEEDYFEVQENKVSAWLDREPLLNRVDNQLHKVAAGQIKQPLWVFLEGAKGCGKTQLALEYCHVAYRKSRFHSVFWLAGSNLHDLQLSVEHAASIVSRTRAGTPVHKAQIFAKFLADRYRPWLVVVDGFDNTQLPMESLTTFFPIEGPGAILITTRVSERYSFGSYITVYKFRTDSDYNDLRFTATKALKAKKIDPLVDALSQDLSADSWTKDIWKDKVMPLINQAARSGFSEGVQLLLDMGANRHQDKWVGSVVSNASGAATLNTILDWEDQNNELSDPGDYKRRLKYAITDAEPEIIEILLARRLKNFDPDEHEYFDGFMAASESGRVDILRYFQTKDLLPRRELTKTCMLDKAIGRSQLEMVDYLLYDVKCSVQELAFGQPVLYSLMQQTGGESKSFRDAVTLRLLAAGASPNMMKPSMGKNALHLASSSGWVSIVTDFIKHGGDPLTPEEGGEIPVILAAESKHTELFPALTNFEIPDLEARQRYYTSALFYAAQHGNRELALAVMKDQSVLDAVDESSGHTPLLAAIQAGEVGLPVARLLVRKGASQRGKVDRQGRAPIVLAAELGLALVVRDLARAADSPGVEATDCNGNTPLMLAARAGNERTVETLLGLGADRDAMNKYGETAEDIAEEKDFKKVLEKLQGFEIIN